MNLAIAELGSFIDTKRMGIPAGKPVARMKSATGRG
jgi:hypothetical protein